MYTHTHTHTQTYTRMCVRTHQHIHIQSSNPLPLFLPVSLHLPLSKKYQSASECSSSNDRDFIRWWRKNLMSDLSWPWWRWTARWCWVRTDQPCSWPWRGTHTPCPPSGPPQCPWCLESWSPRPGGHSKTTVNSASQACHQWPWCLESWSPCPAGHSKTIVNIVSQASIATSDHLGVWRVGLHALADTTKQLTINIVSQACHQWPWHLESWSPQPGGHSRTTVNIVSQACHRWPWRLESWSPQHGGHSRTTVNIASQACHQWPWCLESWSQRPGGHKTTNGQHLTVMLWPITLGDMVVRRSAVHALVDTVRYQNLNIVQSGH